MNDFKRNKIYYLLLRKKKVFPQLTLNDLLHHSLPKYLLTFCSRSTKRYSLTEEHKNKTLKVQLCVFFFFLLHPNNILQVH